jgi:hypothetical protein
MALRSPLYRSFFAFRSIFVHGKIRVFAVGYELLSFAQMGGPARHYFLIARLSEVSIAQNHPSSILY